VIKLDSYYFRAEYTFPVNNKNNINNNNNNMAIYKVQ